MYKTVAEKEAEIAAQNQAAIDAQVQYELEKQQALEQQQEESDAAKQDALTQPNQLEAHPFPAMCARAITYPKRYNRPRHPASLRR